jgi:hypothetical protein
VPDSIHRLPFINAKQASALIEAGITSIDAIDDPSVLGKSTRRYLAARAQGSRTIDRDALDRFLGEIVYPVYYFDYETTQSLLPPWDGVRPYLSILWSSCVRFLALTSCLSHYWSDGRHF